jgi:hypothetical protein
MSSRDPVAKSGPKANVLTHGSQFGDGIVGKLFGMVYRALRSRSDRRAVASVQTASRPN